MSDVLTTRPPIAVQQIKAQAPLVSTTKNPLQTFYNPQQIEQVESELKSPRLAFEHIIPIGPTCLQVTIYYTSCAIEQLDSQHADIPSPQSAAISFRPVAHPYKLLLILVINGRRLSWHERA